MRIASNVKAKRPLRPFSCVIHSDPGTTHDGERFAVRFCDEKLISTKIAAVKPAIDPHGAAEKPRPARAPVYAVGRLKGPEQYCGAMSFRFGHHIHAVVDSVNQIHIGVSGRAKHHTGSRGLSPGGMGSRVMGAKIPLHLDNPADPQTIRIPVHEMFSEKLQSHHLGVSAIKIAGEGSSRWNRIKRCHITFFAQEGNECSYGRKLEANLNSISHIIN
jgi:hypothetical protein